MFTERALLARLPMTVRNVVLTLPCLACAACRVDVEDACVPSTCLHNCAACNSYFLRRLLCGRPSDWAFPGVTAVGSAHWRTSIRSSVLTACATPLLRPRPQSPQQAPQETAHYLRSSFRTLATAPPSLRLPSTPARRAACSPSSRRCPRVLSTTGHPRRTRDPPSALPALPSPVSIASRAPQHRSLF